METLFEVRIKSVQVSVDKDALCILYKGEQVLKVSHAEIKSFVKLIIGKIKNHQSQNGK